MSNLSPTTDLVEIKHLAAARHDDYDILRYQLQLDNAIDDVKLDAWVEALAAPIVAAIDCRECANCCRTLTVGLVKEDVERLATGLECTASMVIENYVDRENSEGEWGVFKARPCAFLKSKLCSVYTDRPETCRLYPAFAPDFRWTLEHIAGGADMCPIIFNVLESILDREKEIYSL